jgi:FtsH-binding integral membrane protein
MGIRLSTETGVVLGLFEILVFLALTLTLVGAAGGHNTLSVFTLLAYPANDAPWIIVGWMLIGTGLLVCFLMVNPRRVSATASIYLEELPTGGQTE